jgi:hypothetical protein
MKNHLPDLPENSETPTPANLQKTLEAYRLNLEALLLFMEKQHGLERGVVAKHLNRSTAKVLRDFRFEDPEGTFFSHTPTGPIPLVHVIHRSEPTEFVFESLAHEGGEAEKTLHKTGDTRILMPKEEGVLEDELTPAMPRARLEKLVETTEPPTPTVPMNSSQDAPCTLTEAILLYADTKFDFEVDDQGKVTPIPKNQLELDEKELQRCLRNG